MIINNKNKADNRVLIIKNKIIEINKVIKSLEYQINIIMKDSCEICNEKITNNNLEITYTLISYYLKKKKYLVNKLWEYYSILSKKNECERKKFLEIWEKEIDTFLNNENIFTFNNSEEENGFTQYEEYSPKNLIKQ